LEKDGYLKSGREIVAGKVRKYYRITKSGSEVLEKSKDKIRELVEEVMK
jgi:DNA-binding PadR family transcriptional regulator